jgi:hypothetical protein
MTVSASHGVQPCVDFMKVNKCGYDEIKLTVSLRTMILEGMGVKLRFYEV